MAGKQSRATAASCLLVILLLSSGQRQQVAAMSKFWRYSGPYPCNFGCIQDCFNSGPYPTTTAGCGDICLMGICDDAIMETGSADVEACVDRCTKNTQDQLIDASRVVTNDRVSSV